MTIYNVIPYFLVLGAIWAIFNLPVFSFIDELPISGTQMRISNIDGLRGFLALSVMVCHSAYYYGYITQGVWGLAKTHFYTPLGGIGVALFFMITGFLFWGKLLKDGGRPDWGALYVGRLFRLGPLYAFTVAVMVFIIFQRCDFELRVPVSTLLQQLGTWFALGLNSDSVPINNFPWTVFILLGVTWSIKYEWWFYFSLVVTSIFIQLKMHRAFVTVGLVAGYGLIITTSDVLWCIPACFFTGMLTASLRHDGFELKLPDFMASLIALAAIGTVAAVFFTHGGVVQIALLGIFFFLVSNRASLFGLLRSKAAHRLGHISYGIYLMQGISLNLPFDYEQIKSWSTKTPETFWLTIFGCALALCICAAITYALIERPGIALGRRIARGRPGSLRPDVERFERAVGRGAQHRG